MIDSCGYCGVELPCYDKWKYCLCEKCTKEADEVRT